MCSSDLGHPENSHLDPHPEDNLITPHFRTEKLQGQQWRLVGLSSGNHTLHVALDLATFNSNLSHIRGIMVLIVITALFFSALGAWLVARRALKPLRSLTRMAEGITANELGQTINDDGADLEFSRLIRVFNEMLARLDASFGQAVRFSADASHELKTPLAVMQGEVETALQQAPNGSEVQATFASQLEEIQRLNNLVGKLLILSHADSGALRPTRDRFDFTEMVRRIFEDIPILDPNLKVEARLDANVKLEGDQDLLRQAVQNLAVNAVRYNIHDGWIRCELSQIENTAMLRVCNSTIAIPADESDKIFNRFYQVDHAREGNHYGLGLSLAREIVQVHGGKLVLARSDDEGTIFELSLPA